MTAADNRRKWAEALRSGVYDQTTARLRIGSAYCCLGVACEVAMESGDVNMRRTTIGYAVLKDGQEWEATSSLPVAVIEWLGLTDRDAALKEAVPYTEEDSVHTREATSLVDLNDGAGYSFEQIAGVIESDGLAVNE